MTIFRNHKSVADRSASDRRRHRDRIEDAIKKGMRDIIADESIIGANGKKRIKIPVRGLKEYRFIYSDGQNNKKVGSATGKGDIGRGQVIGSNKKADAKKGGKGAGDKPGDEFYEIELTLDELSKYLFNDLKLPDLEVKRFKTVLSEKYKRRGYRKKGIRVRLSKKESMKNRIKRKNLFKNIGLYDPEKDERFPFDERDLKYRHIEIKPKESSSAVVFFMMDVSGSMTTNKKYLSRSFFFLLYQFLRYKYERVEIVFISHSTDAKEVSEDDFFNKSTTGGTMISSALEMMKEIVNSRYHPSMWNVYGFHCSDGENWTDDIEKSVKLTQELLDVCQLYGYCEVSPGDESWNNDLSDMGKAYLPIKRDNFKTVDIENSEDVWPSFVRIFGGEK